MNEKDKRCAETIIDYCNRIDDYLNRFDDDKEILTKETIILEEHLQIGNYGGFPSITIPSGFVNNLPVGINFTGNCYDDENVLSIAYALESKLPYKNQIAKEVK